MPRTVATLSADQAEAALSVLCEAFHDYPVMRFVLGAGQRYDQRLRTLIGFFVTARLLREDLILGVRDDHGSLAAVALVTLPGEREPPKALAVRREAVWQELGLEERARYEAFGAAAHAFDIQAPHHHLNMIGVRPSQLGRGYASPLMHHVHSLADLDHASTGVSLNTESQRNVQLYEHFGYDQLGYARVAPALEMWAMFRPARREGEGTHGTTRSAQLPGS
jgi:GNAT superfamily N-acetyltransferase